MGVIGGMFPGKKQLIHEGSQDGDGQHYQPSVEVDLDSGVVRLSAPNPPAAEPDSTE